MAKVVGILLIIFSSLLLIYSFLYGVFAFMLPGMYAFNDSGASLPDINQVFNQAVHNILWSTILFIIFLPLGIVLIVKSKKGGKR